MYECAPPGAAARRVRAKGSVPGSVLGLGGGLTLALWDLASHGRATRKASLRRRRRRSEEAEEEEVANLTAEVTKSEPYLRLLKAATSERGLSQSRIKYSMFRNDQRRGGVQVQGCGRLAWTPQRCLCQRLGHRSKHRVSNPSHLI